MADIWTNLNTFKLGDVEATSIQRQTDPIHIEELNRQSLEDTKLINDASMRSSGSPMPDTGKLVKHEQTDNNIEIVFRPAVGEVYILMGADASAYGGSQNGATLFLSDGINDMVIADSSSAGDMNDHGFRGGTYIDNKLYLSFQPNNIASGTAVLEVGLIRVR